MRLRPHTLCSGEGAELRQRGGGTADGEAGRDDWVDEGAGGVEGAAVCDYFPGARDSRVGGLTVVFGVCGWVVHADFADEGALAEVVCCVGEEFGGRDMEGGVVGGCGDALV